MDLQGIFEKAATQPAWLWVVLIAIAGFAIIFIILMLKAGQTKDVFGESGDFMGDKFRDFTGDSTTQSLPGQKIQPSVNLKPIIAIFTLIMFASGIVVMFIVFSAVKQEKMHSAMEMEKQAKMAMEKHLDALKKTEMRQKLPDRAAMPKNEAVAAKQPASDPKTEMMARARTIRDHATSLIRKGEYAEAETLLRDSLSFVQKAGKKGVVAKCAFYNSLAYVLEKQAKDDEAEVHYLRAITASQKAGKPESVGVAQAKTGLARIFLRHGRIDEVGPLYKDAIKLWDKTRGPGNGNSAAIMDDYARLLDRLERHAEAAAMRKKAAMTTEAARTLSAPSAVPKIDSMGVRTINLSIAEDFQPVLWSSKSPGSSSFPQTNKLSAIRPPQIIREPHYSGTQRRYGYLKLGIPAKTYCFALDRVVGSHPVMYFDKNGNKDLTDDGPPLVNRGTGFFATTISIPAKQVLLRYSGSKIFDIWFNMREKNWNSGGASHYSRTQMKGYVMLGNRKYLAYLADRGVNDADFSNDGIYLDKNRDGDIDSGSEHIRHGLAVEVNGAKYRFVISP